MIRKLFILLAALLPLAVSGQYGTGAWKFHPFFVSTNLQNNIDTGDKVYYLVNNSLYCYDKATQENESLNKGNYLSDVTVTGIYYNADKKYVMATYNNSNIDVIMDDGRIINMPEIKDAVVSQSKVINDVTFDGDRAYVATGFGYVVIDDKNFVIKESHYFNESLASVARVGEYLIVATATSVKNAKIDAAHESMADFSNWLTRNEAKLTGIDDDRLFVSSNKGIELWTIKSASYIDVNQLRGTRPKTVAKTKQGFAIHIPTDSLCILTDAEGNITEQRKTMELLSSCPSGDGTVWALGDKGLHKDGDNSNYFKPNAIGISANAYWSTFNEAENKLYLARTTDNAILTSANKGAKTEIWTYDGNTWEDATPPDVPIYSTAVGSTYEGNYWLNFEPGTANNYVTSLRAAGTMYVVDGKIKAVFKKGTNTPRDDKYAASTAFDSEGNLWCVQSYQTTSHPVMVLPHAKLANAETVKSSDWICPKVANIDQGSFKRNAFVIAKGSNVKVFTTGAYQAPVVFWSEEGNLNNLSPKSKFYNKINDQDGKQMEWTNIICLASDNNGMVWMGTDLGIMSFDPVEALTDNFHGNHIKVPRNDGTNLADYLLDGIQVNCITVDKANRKWIGTNSAGLFLVSPDGTQILKQFNTDNSLLSSNTIYSISCNTNNNSVYIVTNNGVQEYFSDTTPGSADYSDVKVYPNPVRPDFTGLVTISGLMENSLVKIADASGNVVKQLKSIGGMCTWDCCNDSGERVNTGVYYVLASMNDGSNSDGAVAKFLIVK
ncbi:MAG: hypothetical protein KBT10_02365 [Bacteroidales bacterium]|nr:hypothetical protein [Candidatus Sodaliphilus aphodohippi]